MGRVCMYSFSFSKLAGQPKLPRELFKSVDSLGALPPEMQIHRRSEGSGGLFQVKPGEAQWCQAACAGSEETEL